jgi:hypothetical protein
MPPKKAKSAGASSDKAVGAALRALPASGPLPDDTRSLLYGITRPCNGQSRCRDPDKNPNCLCALRPLTATANSASRGKRGELWRFADADAVKTLTLRYNTFAAGASSKALERYPTRTSDGHAREYHTDGLALGNVDPTATWRGVDATWRAEGVAAVRSGHTGARPVGRPPR